MYQGKGLETDKLNRTLGVDPAEVDYLILSHAHIDHSGLVPYMYKLGFRGTIFATNATRDLCSIMLSDSAHIQELDIKWFNKKRLRNGLSPVEPIYTIDDAEGCMALFVGVAYNKTIHVNSEVKLTFTHSGHMLGSAVVNLQIHDKAELKSLAFTGDIGRTQNRLLIPPAVFPPCDYLITESTYGDRLHTNESESVDALLQIVTKTCVQNKGKLIIPAFSVGRTQEIVFVLNGLYNTGLLPRVKVYVDSPLSVNATEIFRLHTECMNNDVRQVMRYDDDPFGFNSLRMIRNVDESKALNTSDEPCIIISSSGMAEAGRVKHHIANNISNWRNTILLVGYCSPTSLGARIQEPGLRFISIFGELREVNATIERIDAFSGHGDYSEMIDFISCQNKNQLKKVFLVHGEYQVQKNFAQKLNEVGFNQVEIPERGQTYDL